MSNDMMEQMMADKAIEVRGRWTMQVSTKSRGAAVEFLTNVVDELIVYVEQNFSVSGDDKKALVIAAVDKVYDTVVVGLMPIWLRPFATPIKNFIVNTVVSVVIDFIVRKYNEGGWKLPTVTKDL